MKLSARNPLDGIVESVAKGATTAHVRIGLAAGTAVTASATNEAADEFGLAPGKPAIAIVKAGDARVAVP